MTKGDARLKQITLQEGGGAVTTNNPDITGIVARTDIPNITVETCYQLINQVYAADRKRSAICAVIHRHWPASLLLQ